jgi:LmbE family N-acetylglucosaminyl deacetylase
MNLIISPHLDDAVLSCGQMIADNSDCTVVTVFAGIPPHDQLTPYDEHSAFKSSRDAVIARRAEDIRAMRVLEADYIHLDHLDSQYQPLKPEQVRDDLERVILAHFPEGEERRVLSPYGLRHPDHELVYESVRAIWAHGKGPIDRFFVYEELPYRVLWPEAACKKVYDDQIGIKEAKLGVGNKTIKRKAVAFYVSQAWSTDLDCVFVPERFWEIW